MTQEIDLKELEFRVWTSTFQDGLYDLFLGWLILWMGIIFNIDDTGLSSPVLLAINMSVICSRSSYSFLESEPSHSHAPGALTSAASVFPGWCGWLCLRSCW
jgi:hypothetical protein